MHNASEASKLEATEYLLLRSLPCRVYVCIYIYRYKKLWLSTSMYYPLFATRVFACSAVPVGHVCLSLESRKSLKLKDKDRHLHLHITVIGFLLPLWRHHHPKSPCPRVPALAGALA